MISLLLCVICRDLFVKMPACSIPCDLSMVSLSDIYHQDIECIGKKQNSVLDYRSLFDGVQ